MSTQTIFVVTNAKNELVAISSNTGFGAQRSFISPVAGHSLHRLDKVPLAVLSSANPDQFHKDVSSHLRSAGAKITLINPAEHRNYWLRHMLAGQDK